MYLVVWSFPNIFTPKGIREAWDQVGGARGREGAVSADGWGVTNDKPL